MRWYSASKVSGLLKMRITPSSSLHVSVASWNVLADSYAYSQQPTKVSSSESENVIPTYIEWDFRKQKIAESISNCGADILCLQEVDHYADFYEPLLGSLGYKSVYLQRYKRKDGCLIAFNSDKYQLHGVDEVQFDDLAEYMDNESAKSNMKRSNVALIAVMSSKENPIKKFISSTAHMYWNPRRPEVKSLQTQYLVSRINDFITAEGLSPTTPVFMAGDFNSVPYSEPYQLLVNGFENLLLQKGMVGLQNVNGALYGPKTKFLCDRNLGRLCRWMRVLGIDTALIPDMNNESTKDSDGVAGEIIGTAVKNTPKIYTPKKKGTFDHIFTRARDEQRVILTTSKSMRERSLCPPSFLVSTKNLEAALIEVCKEYGLSLDQEKFLTVCGKCGGEIEACSHVDPRVSQNTAVPPLDREIFICKECSQPYWWNERENSSPARAMKMADKLFSAITRNQTAVLENIRAQVTLDKEPVRAVVKEVDTVVSFALSERITIAIQSTGIKEENIDRFSNSEELKEENSDETAYLTELFNKRNKTIKLVETSRSVEANLFAEHSSSSTLKAKDVKDTQHGSENNDMSDKSSREDECDSLLDKLSLQESSGALIEPNEAAETTKIAAIAILAEVTECSLTKSSLSRVFASAYASVHDGKEPEATNWSFDFKDTLDYVFMSEEWVVEAARVIPSINAALPSVSSVQSGTTTPLEISKEEGEISGKGSVSNDNSYNNLNNKNNGKNRDSLIDENEENGDDNDDSDDFKSLDVAGPQPSEVWPSDHFMIVVKASF